MTLFQIDIMNFIQIKAVFAKDFHIPPSELDKMPVWEYVLFMKEMNKLVKEENERNQKEMDDSGYKNAKKMSDPHHAQRMSNKYMNSVKTPDFGNIKMPSMPKL
jgi:hypothetical protein